MRKIIRQGAARLDQSNQYFTTLLPSILCLLFSLFFTTTVAAENQPTAPAVFVDATLVDPCNCPDPLNYINGNDYYFHDRVRVNTTQGTTVRLVFPGSEGVFDNTGEAVTSDLTFTEVSPGIYELEVWTALGVPYVISIETDELLSGQLTGVCEEVCEINTCPDRINLTLADNCASTLTLDMITNSSASFLSTIIVSDSDPSNGNVIDGVGLFEYGVISAAGTLNCWGEILVEDKAPPTIVCPADTVVECFLEDLVLENPWSVDSDSRTINGRYYTGEPTADDCYLVAGYDWSDQVNYYPCDTVLAGRITRRFTVRDEHGLTSSCNQTIDIERVRAAGTGGDFTFTERDLDGDGTVDFYKEHGKWVHEVHTCSADPAMVPAPVYPRYRGSGVDGRARDGLYYDLDEIRCNLSTEVGRRKFLDICSGNAYKEERQISVFDWCAGMTVHTYSYTVKVGDFKAPKRVASACPGFISLADTLTSSAAIVDALNSGTLSAAEVCGRISTGPMECTAALNISLSALERRFGDLLEDCNDEIEISVDVLSYLPVQISKIPTGNTTWAAGSFEREGDMIMGLPVGKHAILITAADGCYNTGNFILFIEVEDEVKPVMKCDDNLRVTLVEGDEHLGIRGYAFVSAADLDEGSWDNCDLVELQVRRSFLNDPTGAAKSNYLLKNDPDGTGSIDILTDESGSFAGGDDYTDWSDYAEFFCADATQIGPNEVGVRVELRGTDRAGNHDYCVTNILIQDYNNTCRPTRPRRGGVAGLIATEEVYPVEATEMQLSGGSSRIFMTDAAGDYQFEDLAYGEDYTVAPHKDQDHRNGVSTFDLILIQKHILGTALLDSPYKLIAADANNSRSITTLDLIQIRKLVLNIDTKFANNTSWRFVDADYNFPDATNPWAGYFPEFKNINNLDRTELVNFVGIKVGDVNSSAQVNNAQAIRPRAAEDMLEIHTEEMNMQQGKVYTVSFKANMEDIMGYQFTLEVDQAKARIVDVQEGIAKAPNFGVFAEAGVLTTSFHRSGEETLAGEVLFSLTLRATADGALSEAIGISSRYTIAEAYAMDDEELAIGLLVGKDDSPSAYLLSQNRPNPFTTETVIGFNLPEAMEAVVEFRDMSGRRALLRTGNYTQGYNELRLQADELPATGVYFYTLYAGDFAATRKLVLIGQ